jgi:hypothetical protein
MGKRSPSILVVLLTFLPLAAYSQPSNAAARNPGLDLTTLFSRIWQDTGAASKPAPGSIYIFLPNGTLLQTSCVETYRIATWTIDKKAPSVLRVMEDKQLAFEATITELTDRILRLKQNLVRSKEVRNLVLKPIERELVCPPLRK